MNDGRPDPPLVVFVCRHGSAKSVLAAEELRRAARERGIAIRVLSAGIDPDLHVAPGVIDCLPDRAADLRCQRARQVTAEDVATAS